MQLNEYFSNTAGTGILSTSNAKGEVNSALYAIPHVLDATNVQFIMRDRLSRANLQENGQACYLFKEKGSGVRGVRLYLAMTGEEQDEEKIKSLSRRPSTSEDDGSDRFLISFKVVKALQLVGGEEIELS